MKITFKKSGRFIDIKGNKFGKLFVIERALDITNKCRAMWKCKCDCGKETIVCGRHLRNGDTKSCGCYKSEMSILRNRKQPHFWTYHQLCKTAHDTGKPCNLTFDEFLEFTKISECHYCKSPIVWKPHRERGDCGAYHIDRKNNEFGYVKENCVVCCSLCNHIKGHRLTYREMIILGPTISIIQQLRKNIKC